MVDAVADAPLHLECRQTGVADEAPIARRRARQPVGEVAAVARAARRLPRAVDESKALDRFVGRVVDVVGRPGERIALDVERELLAVAGRTAIVGQQDDEARL